MVGASPDPARPSHGVMRYLVAQGYRVIPVHPTADRGARRALRRARSPRSTSRSTSWTSSVARTPRRSTRARRSTPARRRSGSSSASTRRRRRRSASARASTTSRTSARRSSTGGSVGGTLYPPRGVAQPGSALRSGRRGPEFKSRHPDGKGRRVRPFDFPGARGTSRSRRGTRPAARRSAGARTSRSPAPARAVGARTRTRPRAAAGRPRAPEDECRAPHAVRGPRADRPAVSARHALSVSVCRLMSRRTASTASVGSAAGSSANQRAEHDAPERVARERRPSSTARSCRPGCTQPRKASTRSAPRVCRRDAGGGGEHEPSHDSGRRTGEPDRDETAERVADEIDRRRAAPARRPTRPRPRRRPSPGAAGSGRRAAVARAGRARAHAACRRELGRQERPVRGRAAEAVERARRRRRSDGPPTSPRSRVPRNSQLRSSKSASSVATVIGAVYPFDDEHVHGSRPADACPVREELLAPLRACAGGAFL